MLLVDVAGRHTTKRTQGNLWDALSVKVASNIRPIQGRRKEGIADACRVKLDARERVATGDKRS